MLFIKIIFFFSKPATQTWISRKWYGEQFANRHGTTAKLRKFVATESEPTKVIAKTNNNFWIHLKPWKLGTSWIEGSRLRTAVFLNVRNTTWTAKKNVISSPIDNLSIMTAEASRFPGHVFSCNAENILCKLQIHWSWGLVSAKWSGNLFGLKCLKKII